MSKKTCPRCLRIFFLLLAFIAVCGGASSQPAQRFLNEIAAFSANLALENRDAAQVRDMEALALMLFSVKSGPAFEQFPFAKDLVAELPGWVQELHSSLLSEQNSQEKSQEKSIDEAPNAGSPPELGSRTSYFPTAGAAFERALDNYLALLRQAWIYAAPHAERSPSWAAELAMKAGGAGWPVEGQWLWLATVPLRSALAQGMSPEQIFGTLAPLLEGWLLNVDRAFTLAYRGGFEANHLTKNGEAAHFSAAEGLAWDLLFEEAGAAISFGQRELQEYSTAAGPDATWQLQIQMNGVALWLLATETSSTYRELSTALFDWVDGLLQASAVEGLAAAIPQGARQAWVRTGILDFAELSFPEAEEGSDRRLDIEALYPTFMPAGQHSISDAHQSRIAALSALSQLGLVFPQSAVYAFLRQSPTGSEPPSSEPPRGSDLLARLETQFRQPILEARTPIESAALYDRLLLGIRFALAGMDLQAPGRWFDANSLRLELSLALCQAYAERRLPFLTTRERLVVLWSPTSDIWSALQKIRAAAFHF